MSGRYALYDWPEAWSQLPGFNQQMRAHWNLAPKSQVLMLYQKQDTLHAAMALWGFTSAWMTDLTRAVAHARVETVKTQPMFKKAWRTQRCLLPANGFFEWRGLHRKHPFWLSADDSLLYFAAIWDVYAVPGQDYYSVAMLTQQAAHLRRPIVLNQQQQAVWLNPHSSDEALQQALVGAQLPLRERRVSTLINDPLVDGPHCLAMG
ncbi:SOS response-associated peptidase [Pseudomonas sp. C27(2019)]|mgnify:CR=1 FL=1|uniref:SOS response-associated peptidase n=1 Tax=Pseudomonas sp. C27(2019) TaxID=2604941 RepID=UPI001245BFBD|nr:SOS response-associated peptidase family protein [Pseudomonas sp. C27(2019)]QEY59629.1 SOS response-associated peptidase [Pseudomonas sp. C27(2019)]